MRVFRIQDREGRGPFKPGFSHVWRDAIGKDFPAFLSELGWTGEDLWSKVPDGFHLGCACADENQLGEWFSRSERRRLKRLGYRVVEFEPTVVLAATETQVVFAHEQPLSTL